MVLAGEYAVREGYPGLVASVSRFSTATIKGHGPPRVEVAGSAESDLTCADSWKTAQHDPIFDLVNNALDTCQTDEAPWSGTLHLDSRPLTLDFGSMEQKLGLGSSATIAAILARVLYRGSDPTMEEIHQQAQAIHKRFSGGSGSGVDVAAACFGGILHFEKQPGGIRTKSAPSFPKALAVIPVYCGFSVSTRQFLAAVDQFKEEDKDQYETLMSQINEGTLLFTHGLSHSRLDDIFSAVRQMQHAMARLGERSRIDILSEPHQKLVRIAEQFQGAAKPSGAGGGDVGLIFIPQQFESPCKDALIENGFDPLNIQFGKQGLTWS